jgi:hypothetical protein
MGSTWVLKWDPLECWNGIHLSAEMGFTVQQMYNWQTMFHCIIYRLDTWIGCCLFIWCRNRKQYHQMCIRQMLLSHCFFTLYYANRSTFQVHKEIKWHSITFWGSKDCHSGVTFSGQKVPWGTPLKRCLRGIAVTLCIYFCKVSQIDVYTLILGCLCKVSNRNPFLWEGFNFEPH